MFAFWLQVAIHGCTYVANDGDAPAVAADGDIATSLSGVSAGANQRQLLRVQ